MTNSKPHEQMLLGAAAEFPAVFGLRAHDDLFKINVSESFILDGLILLYVYTEAGLAFCKAEPAELRKQIVPVRLDQVDAYVLPPQHFNDSDEAGG